MAYHSEAELVAALEQCVARAGPRATWRSIGRTVAGRELPAVTVAATGRVPTVGRPQLLITANIHGNEVIGSEVALGLLERLTQEPGGAEVEALLAAGDVTVVPAVNLDHREVAVRALRTRRAWAPTARGNGHGVDLNRNFPYPPDARDAWHPLAGARWSALPWYRGPQPLSEPESRAVAELAAELRPRAALNLHSAGELFLYPFCHTARPPAARERFEAMGRAFGAAQPGRPYRVKQARAWYTILGDLDDWLYATHGTLAVTVELGRIGGGVGADPRRLLWPLYWLNPPEPDRVVAELIPACLAAARVGLQAEAPGPTPQATEQLHPASAVV